MKQCQFSFEPIQSHLIYINIYIRKKKIHSFHPSTSSIQPILYPPQTCVSVLCIQGTCLCVFSHPIFSPLYNLLNWIPQGYFPLCFALFYFFLFGLALVVVVLGTWASIGHFKGIAHQQIKCIRVCINFDMRFFGCCTGCES